MPRRRRAEIMTRSRSQARRRRTGLMTVAALSALVLGIPAWAVTSANSVVTTAEDVPATTVEEPAPTATPTSAVDKARDTANQAVKTTTDKTRELAGSAPSPADKPAQQAAEDTADAVDKTADQVTSLGQTEEDPQGTDDGKNAQILPDGQDQQTAGTTDTRGAAPADSGKRALAQPPAFLFSADAPDIGGARPAVRSADQALTELAAGELPEVQAQTTPERHDAQLATGLPPVSDEEDGLITEALVAAALLVLTTGGLVFELGRSH